jgi:hypothetical protein
LSELVLSSRRNLIVVCGLSIAWASAQFAIASTTIELSNVSIDLKEASIPAVLSVLLIYFTTRWALDFSMMSRRLRRWPLAQLDFRMLLFIARFSLLAVAAGALDRSIKSILIIITSLALLFVFSLIFTFVLMFITVPIRVWVRKRKGRRVGTGAIFEGMFWSGLFAVIIAVLGATALGISSYTYAPIREALWPTPPNALSLVLFTITLILVFLSHWLLRPVLNNIFAVRPDYTTVRLKLGQSPDQPCKHWLTSIL